jgi:hypothetical protein
VIYLDYYQFLAVCLLPAVLFLYLLSRIRRRHHAGKIHNPKAQRSESGRGPMRSARMRGTRTGIQAVPTPWGWPDKNGPRAKSPSNSLRERSLELFREHGAAKRLADRERRDICIKALLEDRYGRVFDETGTGSFHYDPRRH